MGMRAHCSKDECDYSEISDNHRGAGLGTCPRDGAPLRAHTAGRAKGRYVCPVYGGVVTLGLSSTRQLTEPMRLVFAAGWDTRWTKPSGPDAHQVRYHRTEPDDHERGPLDAAAGRVFGPGCVVGASFTEPPPGTLYRGRAGLRLIPAPDADPATWFVNEPVTYRKCAACNRRVVADATSLMTAEWTPARAYYWAGKNNRSRRTVDTNPGPHPAGTYACPQCRPGGED